MKKEQITKIVCIINLLTIMMNCSSSIPQWTIESKPTEISQKFRIGEYILVTRNDNSTIRGLLTEISSDYLEVKLNELSKQKIEFNSIKAIYYLKESHNNPSKAMTVLLLISVSFGIFYLITVSSFGGAL